MNMHNSQLFCCTSMKSIEFLVHAPDFVILPVACSAYLFFFLVATSVRHGLLLCKRNLKKSLADAIQSGLASCVCPFHHERVTCKCTPPDDRHTMCMCIRCICMCVWHVATAVLNDKAVKPEEEAALFTAEYSILEFLRQVYNIINNRSLEVYQKGTCLKYLLDNMQQ